MSEHEAALWKALDDAGLITGAWSGFELGDGNLTEEAQDAFLAAARAYIGARKEADYVAATNLSKLRIVEHVMRSVIPYGVIEQRDLSLVESTLVKMINRLEQEVDRA